GRRGRCGVEEIARPTNTALVLRSSFPAPVHVHDEPRIAVSVRRGGGRRPRSGAAQGGEEDLALGRRQLAGIFDDGLEQLVVELRKIVRLPVVAGAGGEQRIEGLLPGRIKLHSDVLADRSTKLTQRRDERLADGWIAGIAQRQRDDLLTVHFGRQERQG